MVSHVATDTCILCGCYPDVDGETVITLGTINEVHKEGKVVFDGTLMTPGRRIAVETVEGDSIFEMPTTNTKTRVQIWTNADWAPDKVTIGVK